MPKNAKYREVTYAAEPANSPLRMGCRSCHAAPGMKCQKSAGGFMHDLFHPSREADFKKLREAEAKMAQMNRDYGKDQA